MKDHSAKNAVKEFIREATEDTHHHNSAHFRSKAATALIKENLAFINSAAAYQKFCTRNLRHEHVVPCEVIYQLLLKEDLHTEQSIQNILTEFCCRATITRGEDEELNKAGYQFKMPHGFEILGDAFYRDPFSRYKVIGLYENLEPLVGTSWYSKDVTVVDTTTLW